VTAALQRLLQSWRFGARRVLAPNTNTPRRPPKQKQPQGEEHAYCQALIEAHKQCLRLEGFNVSGGAAGAVWRRRAAASGGGAFSVLKRQHSS
jgi:hypothetical protein